MNYQLNTSDSKKQKEPILESIKRFAPFVSGEGKKMVVTIIMVIASSLTTLVTPIII